jgi:hypothetical protein
MRSRQNCGRRSSVLYSTAIGNDAAGGSLFRPPAGGSELARDTARPELRASSLLSNFECMEPPYNPLMPVRDGLIWRSNRRSGVLFCVFSNRSGL